MNNKCTAYHYRFASRINTKSRGVYGSGLCLTRNRPEFLGWAKTRIETDPY